MNAVVNEQPLDDAGAPPALVLDAQGVATVTLRRPRHANRLHREDLATLRKHFETLARTPAARALVLTGQGRHFCAGFHLGEFGSAADAAQAAGDPLAFEQVVQALQQLPLPSIARLNGGVYGGATDLALACDFRVGVQGMALRMPAARLGLHYYSSGLQRFVATLGLAAARRLFLLAETVPADELLRLGYLDALVPPDALDQQVATWLQALLAGAPLAVTTMKQSLAEIARGEAEPAQLQARSARCAASEDLREGLAAQAQGRAPQFRGR